MKQEEQKQKRQLTESQAWALAAKYWSRPVLCSKTSYYAAKVPLGKKLSLAYGKTSAYMWVCTGLCHMLDLFEMRGLISAKTWRSMRARLIAVRPAPGCFVYKWPRDRRGVQQRMRFCIKQARLTSKRRQRRAS